MLQTSKLKKNMDWWENLQFSLDRLGRVWEGYSAADKRNAAIRNARLWRGKAYTFAYIPAIRPSEASVLVITVVTIRTSTEKNFRFWSSVTFQHRIVRWEGECNPCSSIQRLPANFSEILKPSPKQPHLHFLYESCQTRNHENLKVLPCNYNGKHSVAIELPWV